VNSSIIKVAGIAIEWLRTDHQSSITMSGIAVLHLAS